MKEGLIVIENNSGAVAQGEKAAAVCTAAEQTSFQPGDTVILKSGSPIMSVIQVEKKLISCVWFRGKENCFGVFPAAALLHKTPEWLEKKEK